jgi:N-acetylmuramoyl-L-alanine amidase
MGVSGFAIMRRRRVIGLLVAAALAGAAAHTAHAEPKPAEACQRATFRAVIDVGHTEKAPGAISARGVPEFVFNSNLGKRIEEQLRAAGFKRSVLLITEGPAAKSLLERVRRAKELAADLFLSIHHDSVPDKLLDKWEFEGVERSFSDRFSGHSIFISEDNSDYAGSLSFARLLGGQLQKRGLKYTPHYTNPIMGHRKRLLVDVLTGVYRYDQLIVLKNTDMPAVLFEAGSIIHRDEELRMGTAEHHALISAAVADAVAAFCKTRRPRTAAKAAKPAGEVSKQPTPPPDMMPVQSIKPR